jgi:hypothetical protein
MFDKIWTNLFNVMTVAFLGLFAYLLFNGRDGQLLSIVAALVSLIAPRMKDVLSFKISATGIEAEMRSLIDEAKATVEQLHLLAISQSKILLESVHAAGRWGGGSTWEDKKLMRANILATLEKLGVESEKIDEVLSVERRYVHFDYSHAVTHDLHSRLSQENMATWNDFFSPRKRKGIGFEPGPDELETFLQGVGLLDDEVRERLEDYRHYDRTNSHRRRDNAIARQG